MTRQELLVRLARIKGMSFRTPSVVFEILKLERDIEADWLDERERCATIALEQRCERNTPWDLACTTIAGKIRG